MIHCRLSIFSEKTKLFALDLFELKNPDFWNPKSECFLEQNPNKFWTPGFLSKGRGNPTMLL